MFSGRRSCAARACGGGVAKRKFYRQSAKTFVQATERERIFGWPNIISSLLACLPGWPSFNGVGPASASGSRHPHPRGQPADPVEGTANRERHKRGL